MEIDERVETKPEIVKKIKNTIKIGEKEFTYVPIKAKKMPMMTKFEYTKLIAERAKQIEKGSPLLIDDIETDDPIDIAVEELNRRIMPLHIKRTYPNGKKEMIDITKAYIRNY